MIEKTKAVVLGAAIAAVLTGAWTLSRSDVVNSRHNLSSTAGSDQITDKSTNEDQVCVFCHTPHQANPAAPLWNHNRSNQGAYGVYASPTLDAIPTEIAGGTDTSNLCMSCHDGTIGVNSLVNFANDTGGNPAMGSGHQLDVTGKLLPTNSTNLGTDLTNDHPVNFTYNAALATTDGQLTTPVSVDWVDAGHTVPLFDAKVQCASCHDAHDSTYKPFLVKANTGSALCLTCHRK